MASSTNVSELPDLLRKVARKAGLALAGVIAAFVLFISIFSIFGIAIDVSWLRDRIEVAATDTLGRTLSIEGPIRLVPGFTPQLDFQGLSISNPPGWTGETFASIDHVRASVKLMSLIMGNIDVGEVSIAGARLALRTSAQGVENWVFVTSTPDETASTPSSSLSVVGVDSLSLRDVQITLVDDRTGAVTKLEISESMVSASFGQPITVDLQGAVQDVPFSLQVKGGSIEQLFEQDSRWPLDAVAEAIGTTLKVNGDIADPLRGDSVALDFSLASTNLSEVEKFLGRTLPPFQIFELAGHLYEQDGVYGVADLSGQLGRTTLDGDVRFDTSGAQPELNGSLNIPRIDLTPFSASLEAESQTPPQVSGDADSNASEESAPSVDPDASIFSLDVLNALDADFTLTIGEVFDSEVIASDATLSIRVDKGRLNAPVKATVAGVPFGGALRVEEVCGEPTIDLSLGSERSEVGDLFKYLVRTEGIEGGFETANLAFSARGASIRSAVESSELRFIIQDAALTYGNELGALPVEFTLQTFDLNYPASSEAKITASGSLIGEPFTLDISGGTFTENFVAENWPVDVQFTGSGAQLKFDGALRDPEIGAGTTFEFSLKGDNIGMLSSWIGISPTADSPYALTGDIGLATDLIRINIEEGSIGSSILSGSLGVQNPNTLPIAYVDLVIDTIDLIQLGNLLPANAESDSIESDTGSLSLDVPLLPADFELGDSNIEFDVGRIVTERGEITGVSLSTKIRDGFVKDAPFKATMASQNLVGRLNADLRSATPVINLGFELADVDVGSLLDQLGIAENVTLTTEQFGLDLKLSGSSIREMLANSELTAELGNGFFLLIDPNTKVETDITISNASLVAARDEQLEFSLNGYLAEIPVEIGIVADSVSSFSSEKESAQAEINVKMLSTELQFSGEVPLPIQVQDLQFKLAYAGAQVSDLDPLFKVSLPPWGPYAVSGQFGTRESGYYLENLALTVGDSKLTGTAYLDTAQSPPLFKVQLTAPSIQLNDFTTEGWTASEGTESSTELNDSEGENDAVSLLSPEVMKSLDGSISVSVQEVLSGKDKLGSGTLAAGLDKGRFAVDPLTLNIPGGDIQLGFWIEPIANEILLGAQANVDQFDYGVLARRIDPESTTGGLISLDADVETRGPDFANAMSGANGHIDLAVWPKDMNAGIFDLWAVNVFTAMLPSLDSDASKVNCVVGRFDIEGGLMEPSALLIDTSRVQASGNGTINFRENRLSFRAAPKPKRPEYFSIRTPVAVRGPFDDFKVQLSPFDLTGTAVRMAASPVVVTFERVFKDPKPADGQIACQEAWGR